MDNFSEVKNTESDNTLTSKMEKSLKDNGIMEKFIFKTEFLFSEKATIEIL